MAEAKTWRELLGQVISNPKEKQRIAEELSVQPITLNRWISGDSEPRAQNLRHLLSVLPQQRDQLLHLIKQEEGYEDFSINVQDDSLREISSEFYTEIFSARASSTANLRFWSLSNAILKEALKQLDPDRQGMAIWIVRCMPPSGPGCKIRSLREVVGQGTPPWSSNLEQKAMFLGAESLTGNVITLCRPSVVENLDEVNNLLPTSRVDYERSCAIYPILYAGRIAGVLLVSSTQYNYFHSRATLVQRYADLVALTLEEEDFYNPDDIALGVMPYHEEQKIFFANFSQRVAQAMINASRNNQYLNSIQADQYVWQQLEEELLQAAMQKNAG